MKFQKGFAHTFLVLGLILVIAGALLFAFWNNYMKQQDRKVSGGSSRSVHYKTYTSFSGSGLTFDYPDSWSFSPPTKLAISRPDQKGTPFDLYTQKPTVTDPSSVSSIKTDFCITLFEMQGNWSFKSQASKTADILDSLMVGQNKVSLVKDRNSDFYGYLQLLADPASRHGAAYIPLKNDYYLLATASRCQVGKSYDGDFTTELEQAESILKSVRISN